MFRNLPRFEYLSPSRVEEAIGLLREHGNRVKVLAGGTDLIPMMKWGKVKAEVIVGLGGIREMGVMEFGPRKGLKLGALCRITDIEKSAVIRDHYPILSQAASVLASVEVRNRATVGGNLCNASPAADMAPSLLALDAKAVIASSKGERVIPLEAFFVGPGKTCLKQGELLVRLEVPAMGPRTGGEYIKLGIRKAMEISLVGAAAVLRVEGGKCEDARLALGSVAPKPMRAKKAEGVLKGKKVDQGVIAAAADEASKEASPITDIRGSEWYRREMVRVLSRRAIENALGKIKR